VPDSFQGKASNRMIVGLFTLLDRLSGFVGPRIASLYSVTVKRNLEVSAWDSGTTHVDLYTPKRAQVTVNTRLPIAIVIHGGGFRFFSKDSHAPIAAMVAEMGFLTFSVNYRLTPRHAYPDGLIDVLSVYEWVLENGERLGGATHKITLLGESAGANLAVACALVASKICEPPRFPEKIKSVHWITPQKLVLHCGYHLVSGVDSHRDLSGVSEVVRSRMRMIERNYLRGRGEDSTHKEWMLADPLLVLEERAKLGSKLPADFPEVFIPVGEDDPVLTDSLRIKDAFVALGVRSEFKLYPKSPHAFYVMPWHQQFKVIWKDIRSFLVPKAP